MAYEIERKFLVDTEKFDTLEGGRVSEQGYIFSNEVFSQVRVSKDMTRHKGYINIKGYRDKSKRLEVQAAISEEEADALLKEIDSRDKLIKKRITKQFCGNEWVIDVYEGENKDLVVAEIEIPHEKYEFKKPDWILTDITDDDSFYNVNLAATPYRSWSINNINRLKILNGNNWFAFDKVFSRNDEVRIIPRNESAREFFGDTIVIGTVSKKTNNKRLVIKRTHFKSLLDIYNEPITITMFMLRKRQMDFTIDCTDHNLAETDFIIVDSTGNNEIIHGDRVGHLTSYLIEPSKRRVVNN